MLCVQGDSRGVSPGQLHKSPDKHLKDSVSTKYQIFAAAISLRPSAPTKSFVVRVLIKSEAWLVATLLSAGFKVKARGLGSSIVASLHHRISKNRGKSSSKSRKRVLCLL